MRFSQGDIISYDELIFIVHGTTNNSLFVVSGIDAELEEAPKNQCTLLISNEEILIRQKNMTDPPASKNQS